MMDKRKHILQVNIDNNGGNGAFALVRYLYSEVANEYIFDYFTMGEFIADSAYEEIQDNGGMCFSGRLRKNRLLGHLMLPFAFYKTLRTRKYQIVHIHSEVAYKHLLYALTARIAHTEIIIIHSHSSNVDGDYRIIKRLLHKMVKPIVCILGNRFVACSEDAAKWMFTKEIIEKHKYVLIENGITPQLYRYNQNIRDRMRAFINCEDSYILGHVGALKWVKNQLFLIKILQRIREITKEDYRLILVGEGEDRRKIEKEIIENSLDNYVFLLGSRTDVNNILQAFDMFVMPSHYEGMPISMIEAQCVGMPVVASSNITPRARINENVYFCSIDSGIDEWCKIIVENVHNHIYDRGYEVLSNSKFNIKQSANSLRYIYEEN